jgi:drug/metabolite transporter (DMT)-like permease
MRGAPPEDLDAALLGSGLVTALVAVTVMGVLGIGVLPGARDVGLGLLHGGVVLAIGLVLFARGSRTVPGVTLVMLAQAETVAAPVLTWLFLGETTTLAVVAGGAIILVAVVLQAMDGTARRSAAAGGAGATQTDTTRG